MYNKLVFVFTMALFFALTACSDHPLSLAGNAPTPIPTLLPGTPTPIVTPSVQDLAIQEMNGNTYYSACQDQGQTAYSFTGNTLILHTILYSDDSCSQAVLSLEQPATFLLGYFSTFFNIDVNYSAVGATPRVQSIVDELNSESACGLSNWTLNVTNDLTGNTSCLDDSYSPHMEYDILALTDTTVQLGDKTTGDTTTSTTRPTTLDLNRLFTK